MLPPVFDDPAPSTPSYTVAAEEGALVQVTATFSKLTESKYAVRVPLFRMLKLYDTLEPVVVESVAFVF